ncbi:hypothetical protein B0H63DRAFT_550681 [Podospora didyma]|uniref:Protein kinase domain-containing protein n=1 Tax=Podospora didyma TaxID=330526 RepID=A0AAE0K9N4_9PEZI|nr:hypothetical protein B0H63DRAFT_550681 [Podospora didyma]
MSPTTTTFNNDAIKRNTLTAGTIEGGDQDISPSVPVPEVKSPDDLVVIKCWDVNSNALATTFLLITDDNEVFFGQASQDQDPGKMSLNEYTKALKHAPDGELFPKLPGRESSTIAADKQDEDGARIFVKGPGLYRCQPGVNMKTPPLVLRETLIMEALSRYPHPNIIRYHGCRVRRGCITAIVLDKHGQTLSQLAETTPDFFSSGFNRRTEI